MKSQVRIAPGSAFSPARAAVSGVVRFGCVMVRSKEEKSKYNAAYREKNKDKIKAVAATWRETHGAAWSEANRDSIREYHTAWRAANRKKMNAYGATWEKKNKERARKTRAAYRKTHLDACAAYSRNRRARKAAAPGDHTASDIKILKSILGNACLKCGATKDVVIDHIVPLAKGGGNGPTNLQPLCRHCNASKQCERTDYRTKAQIKKITEAFQLTLGV